MAKFEKGNEFWIFREGNGKFKTYTLKEWCEVLVAYFEHMKTQKWDVLEPIKSGESAGTVMKIPVQVPLTRKGLAVFACISEDTIRNYASNKPPYIDYFEVTNAALQMIDNNQIEGALINAYNSNLVARIQGIKENTDVTTQGEKINHQTIDFGKIPTDLLIQLKDSLKDE